MIAEMIVTVMIVTIVFARRIAMMMAFVTTMTDALPMIDFDFKSGWLTLNRSCNLRCKWCYARDTQYKTDLTMNLKLAYELIDFFDSIYVRHLILIGGEPTIHPHFFEILEYAKQKNIYCSVVTNGLAFRDDEFLNKYKSSGMKKVSLSLKGENKEIFKEITGYDGFQMTLDIIRKLVSSDISVSASMVLTENNMNSFMDVIPTLMDLGVKNFGFSFCYDFNTRGEKNAVSDPLMILDAFKSVYEKLNSVTKGRFSIQSGYPLCYWDQELLAKMIRRRQISTICQLLERKGLIFDSEGYHIPCNAMHMLRLGKFKEDFFDPVSFEQYLKTDAVQTTYQKLCGVPDEECLSCKKLSHCGGGCVCQWTNYHFRDYYKKTV